MRSIPYAALLVALGLASPAARARDVWHAEFEEGRAIAMAQVKISTTVVRMAVARLESIPATPTLARIAVAAAKNAERSAQISQFMQSGYAPIQIIRL